VDLTGRKDREWGEGKKEARDHVGETMNIRGEALGEGGPFNRRGRGE